jgi:hypothetical protein
MWIPSVLHNIVKLSDIIGLWIDFMELPPTVVLCINYHFINIKLYFYKCKKKKLRMFYIIEH